MDASRTAREILDDHLALAALDDLRRIRDVERAGAVRPGREPLPLESA